MKTKLFHFEAYTITETARRLGYKSTKTLYRLLRRKVFEDYVYIEKSGRIYLILEPPNKISLKKKILDNIQIRQNNIMRGKSEKNI